MDAKERAIIRKVEQDEPLRPSELGIKNPYHKVDKLVVEGRLGRKKYGDRYTLLFMPSHEKMADERFYRDTKRNIKVGADENLRNELKLSHTQDIKEQVIKPWLKQLPRVSLEDGIRHYFMDASVRYTSVHYTGFLPVQCEVLFSDFKEHHVAFSPNSFDELDKFRRKADEYSKKRNNIFNIILTGIGGEKIEIYPFCWRGIADDKDRIEKLEKYAVSKEEKMKKSPLHGEVRQVKNIPPPESKSEKVERLYEVVFDSFKLHDWIFKALCQLIVHKESRWWKTWKGSYVEEIGDFYSYRIRYLDTTRNIFGEEKDFLCGFIEKKEKGKEEFQQEMDWEIRILTDGIASRKDIRDEIIALRKIVIDLGILKGNIKQSLEKHKMLEVLPGDCEYYPWYGK